MKKKIEKKRKPARIDDILSLPEFEERARQQMSQMAYEYVASGAGEEHTLRWNLEAFDRIALRPRVPESSTTVDTSVVLFDHALSFPILLAPTAYHKVLHPDGELATARAASAAHATWVVSSATNTPIEEIAQASAGSLWFQLYFQSDREFTSELIDRVEAVGCEAICLTVDTPVLGARNRQTRAAFRMPPGVSTPHLYDVGRRKQEIMDPQRVVVTWREVEWLAGKTRLPLVVKGILTADDAERAIEAGARCLVVSNHGGRNLDTLPATIEALPEVANRVAGRVPLLIDGGIRRGTDVLKGLARGATAVMIGRPYCYALAVGGEAGVVRAIRILREELEMAMILTGRYTLKDVDGSILW
jgi:4-hydroxymandelate oxidase